MCSPCPWEFLVKMKRAERGEDITRAHIPVPVPQSRLIVSKSADSKEGLHNAPRICLGFSMGAEYSLLSR